MLRRVALVTGASRGAGAATARALARRGWDVAITARTVREGSGRAGSLIGLADSDLSGSLEMVAADIEAYGGRVLTIAMDLTDEQAVATAAAQLLAHFGGCDALCNIAAYQGPGSSSLFLDTTADQFLLNWIADVLAPAILCRALMPSMIERGGGTIFNLSSYSAISDPTDTVEGEGWSLAYSSAKAGIERFAGVINAELGDKGIRAYTGDPGFMALPERWADARAKYPDAPVSPPEAVGEAIAWVVDDRAADRLIGKRLYMPQLAVKHGLLPGWGGPGSPWPA